MLELNSLYSVVSNFEDKKYEVKLADESHPIFQAHFPNNPLLPGFCHIEIISDITKHQMLKIKQLKLSLKSLPNELIIYELESKSPNKQKVKIKNELGKTIGTFTYEYK